MNERNDRGLADHESDPAHTPGEGWGDEGGASHLGPATHLESGHGVEGDEPVDTDDAKRGET